MAIAWADVVYIAPELSTVATATQNAILADVALQLSSDAWGVLLDLGSKYLAAHLATVSKRKGQGATVTAETVGAVSRQYAAPAVAVGALGSTGYGLEYERLLMNLPAARLTLG